MDDDRWLIHIDGKHSRVEPEKLSRRHLTLTPSALVRLLMGHTGITTASDEDGFIASTSTALDAARDPVSAPSRSGAARSMSADRAERSEHRQE